MEQIRAEVAGCKACRLWMQRKRTVPGEGDLSSRVMFIGEAPGRREDLMGVPFVGAAGRFMDDLLTRISLLRDELYITNVVKCRPPDNRDPRPKEIAACTELYLERQIQLIRPTFLVLLGRHSTRYVLGKAGIAFDSLTKIHGNLYRVTSFGFPMIGIPTFHPAAALYKAKYKELIEQDFWTLKSRISKGDSR
jgi:uracil-DNA glycosylase family 4